MHIIVQGIKERIWITVMSLPVHVRCPFVLYNCSQDYKIACNFYIYRGKSVLIGDKMYDLLSLFTHLLFTGVDNKQCSKMPQYTISYYTSKSISIYYDSMALKKILEPNKSNDTLLFLRLNILYFRIFLHLSSRYD